jgi:hypothetical protein
MKMWFELVVDDVGGWAPNSPLKRGISYKSISTYIEQASVLGSVHQPGRQGQGSRYILNRACDRGIALRNVV